MTSDPNQDGMFGDRVADTRKSTTLVKQHLEEIQATQKQSRIESKIDGFFNGEENVQTRKLGQYSSQPNFKSMRDKELFGKDAGVMSKRNARQQQVAGRAKNLKKINQQLSQSFGTSSDQASSDSEGYSPGGQKNRQPRFEQLAAPISSQDPLNQITKMRKQISRSRRAEDQKASLHEDFSGLGVKQLMTTERDLSENRNDILLSQKRLQHAQKHRPEYNTVAGQTEEPAQARLPKNIAQGNQAYVQKQSYQDLELEVSPEAQTRFNTARHMQRPRVNQAYPSQIGQRKVSSPMEIHKTAMTQSKDEIIKNHAAPRMFSSQNSQSHMILQPISNKAGSKIEFTSGRKMKMLNKGKSNAPFLQKVKNQNNQRQLVSAQSQKTFKTNKAPSHMEKVMSKLTVFKRKIEIDDEQDRLGPNNKVNLQKHSDLYFNTNPKNLLLNIIESKQYQEGYDDSSSASTYGSHSFRSRIVQNEVAMNRKESPEMRHRASNHLEGMQALRRRVIDKEKKADQEKRSERDRFVKNQTIVHAPTLKTIHSDDEQMNSVKDRVSTVARRKSMAPVRDWQSTVTRRIQENQFGKETCEKHYEKEAVAKYIYNKFGVHLLTFNHMTRNEVIPMFGEHIRQTNAMVFNEDKNVLQNRKASAMRSHFVSLKRDLKKQNLPLPKQLKGVEQGKFVRKRVMEEQAHAQSFMNSPRQSLSPPPEYMSLMQKQYSTSSQTLAGKRFGLFSQLSQPNFHGYDQQSPMMKNYYDSDDNLLEFMPQRPVIDQDMDNLEWQRKALRRENLFALYEAKCLDLQIKVDDDMLAKFCTHIICKAKNRCLNLSNCYFKENSARVLARQFMMYNQRVCSYDLSFNELGDRGVASIAEAIQRTRHIIYLNLDMNSICWEGVQHLSKALQVNNSLIHLSLSSGKSGGNNRNRVMERGSYELSVALAENKFLQILNLTGNAIANEGLSYLLAGILKSNTLVSLNLTSNEITSGPIRQSVLKDKIKQGFSSRIDYDEHEVEEIRLDSLKPRQALRMFDEDQKEKKRYRLQTAYLIKEFLKKTKSLKEFTIKSNKIGDEGMLVIAESLTGHSSQIEYLNLTQTSITSESVKTLLINLRSNHCLSTLILDKNNLNTSYAFSPVNAFIASNSSIRVFSCAHCHLSDTFGMSFAEALKTNRGLSKFNFYDNELTSRTLTSLAVALKDLQGGIVDDQVKGLVEFNLGKNNLNDKGGVKLGEAIRNCPKTLSKINLCDNNLTDETALAINRNLMSQKMIEEVNLARNLINLRVLEMVESTCAKIKEKKVKDQLPNQQKHQAQFKNDREERKQVEENRLKQAQDLNKIQVKTERERLNIEERKRVLNKKLSSQNAIFEQLKNNLEKLNQSEFKLVSEYKLVRDQGEIDCKRVEKRIDEIEAENDLLQKELEAKVKEKDDVLEKFRGEESLLNQKLKKIKADKEFAQLKYKNEQEKQKRNPGGETGRNQNPRLSKFESKDRTESNMQGGRSRRATQRGRQERQASMKSVQSSDRTSNLNHASPRRDPQEASQIQFFKNSSSQNDESEYSSRQATALRKIDTQSGREAAQTYGNNRTMAQLVSQQTVGTKSTDVGTSKKSPKKPTSRKVSRQGSRQDKR